MSTSSSFKVIGGDGKEYGPIDLATLQQWAREGRLTSDLQVWDSRTNGWLRAGDIAELAAIFGSAPAQPPAMHAVPVPLAPLPSAPRTNALAIWSLVLSLVALCCTVPGFCCGLALIPGILCAIAAIICGFMALSQFKMRGEAGRGMAIAGIVVGIVVLVLSAVVVVLTIVAFGIAATKS